MKVDDYNSAGIFKKKFDLNKLLNDEFYAMGIHFKIKYNSLIDNRITIQEISYDDIIYTMSILYGSFIDKKYFNIFRQNKGILANIFFLYSFISFFKF